MDFSYPLDLEYSEENTGFEDVDEILSESAEKEKQRLRQQIQGIDKELERRSEIKKRREEKVQDKIRQQENRLRQAQKPGEDEVRDRLEQLYIEKRELPRKQWLDTQELKKKKRGLERQLQEIEDSEEFDDLLQLD